MKREPSPSGRPSGTTTQANPFLKWFELPDAEPAAGDVAEDAELTVTIDESPEAPDRPRGPRTHAWLHNRTLRGVAIVAAVVLVAVGVYSMGRKPSVPGISGATTDQPSAAATQLDQTKVAALMKQISANPKDKTALQSLGDLYFQAGDYQTASSWEQKILNIEPKNITALLALGACQFNLGNGAAAEKSWLTVVGLAPKQAEAHYDLGFLYLSKNPPDMAKVKVEWNKVVAIDPTSEVAKSVKAHLKSLDSKSPATNPTTSGK